MTDGVWGGINQPIMDSRIRANDDESPHFRAVPYLPITGVLRPTARALHGLPREGVQD